MKYIDNVASLTYDSSKCIGCRKCVQVCPHKVFKMIGKKAEIANFDNCIECGACKMNCPVEAIDVEAGVGCAQAIISVYIQNNKVLNFILNKTPFVKDFFGSSC